MLALLLGGLALAQGVSDPMIEAELGQGVVVHGDEDFSFQIRGRAQERVTLEKEGAEDVTALFQVRRLRLVLLAKAPAQDLQIYIQLGFAPQDLELDQPVPLRDALVTWTPTRDVGVRIGQTKVPFSRERVVSSSALQFVDRSIHNAELTLDRDIGLQLFSNDLFGLDGLLAYQIGVFNGDGRNRGSGAPGLLVVARVEVRPLGPFDDSYVMSDVDRDPDPRLAIAASVARNADTAREGSTFGDTYTAGRFTYEHAEADFIFKASGFSLFAESMVRRADRARVTSMVDGVEVTDLSRSAFGWSAATGYVFPNHLEPAVRIAEVHPLGGIDTAVVFERELRAALSLYLVGHDLKLQTDYGYLTGADHPGGTHEIRSQLQVFF